MAESLVSALLDTPPPTHNRHFPIGILLLHQFPLDQTASVDSMDGVLSYRQGNNMRSTATHQKSEKQTSLNNKRKKPAASGIFRLLDKESARRTLPHAPTP